MIDRQANGSVRIVNRFTLDQGAEIKRRGGDQTPGVPQVWPSSLDIARFMLLVAQPPTAVT